VPEMQYVDSSNIEQVGYDADQSELHVVFNDGSHYVYQGVPGEVFEEMINAPSKGSFLNREVKNVYSFVKQ